jgi:hypothetical protein
MMKIAVEADEPKGSRNVLAALAGAFMVSESFRWEIPIASPLGRER